MLSKVSLSSRQNQDFPDYSYSFESSSVGVVIAEKLSGIHN